VKGAARTEKIPARLNVVTLGVRDLPAVRSFYEALGWQSHSADDRLTRSEIGGAVLALYSLDALVEEANMPPRAEIERFAGFTCAIVVQSEEMVDAAIEEVREAGAYSPSQSHGSGADARPTSPIQRAIPGRWLGCRVKPSMLEAA
jgi:predicted lactoylglutathione lyase